MLRERYGTAEACAETSLRVRPQGRDIFAAEALPELAVILPEFSGVRYARERSGWGYD